MDFVAIGRTLSDLGWVALFLASLAGATFLLLKGELVMGWVHARLEARYEKLDRAYTESLATIREQSDVITSQAKVIESQERTIEQLSRAPRG
jgi:uncharacterized membrane protein YbaN (DUF454 family)